MSPTSYQTAPSRDNIKKEDVGFEPTHAVTRLTVFKTVPLSHLGNPPRIANRKTKKDLVFQRRRRDLNPRAAYATYTLSRGASSAT